MNDLELGIVRIDRTKVVARHLLIKHEGLRLKPYKCTAGKLTIGVGRNLEDRGITEGEAKAMLEYDINAFRDLLKTRYNWFLELSQVRQAVIIDMAFNMGMNDFHKFKNTRGFLAKHNYQKASEEMLDSDWARNDVPNRARELAEIMRTGEIR
jgi:lysozyme